LPYTTLDLPAKLKVIIQKAVADIEKAKKQMGGARAVPGIQSKCKADCEKEIARMMDIYFKEEEDYVKQVGELHAASKDLVKKIEAGGPKATLVKLAEEVDGNHKKLLKLQSDLQAHQGFRASCWPDTKTAPAALGADVAKAVEAQFVKDRAPMIAKVAALKDQKVKIEEFVKRAWDLAEAGSSGAGVGEAADTKLMAKEIAAREDEFKKMTEEVKTRKTQLDTMQKFVVGMNTKKMTKPLADIEFKRSTDYVKQTKAVRAQVKTLLVALDSLKKRLGPAISDPKIKPLLASLEKHYAYCDKEISALEATQTAYDKKILEAKKQFA